ncbi:MAG: T9SS type A sorting domain-containing protein [Cyclobacteriaceae bacterium]
MKFYIAALLLITSLSPFAQCPPSGGGDFDGSITITTACTVSSSLVLKKNNITINAGGSLTITGDFDNDGNGTILLNGGTLTTTGAFNNNGNGTVTVQNGSTLDVGTDYFNSGNGTTNFDDGNITIGGDYTNNGNGNIAAGGVVSVGGDFTVDGNGTNTISGGLAIGGTADLGSKGIDISSGGVLQANAIISEGDIDIGAGGTLNVTSGSITGTVNNDPSNVDQDCTNNCCGELCNAGGDDLSGDGESALPIELLYFEASTLERGIQLVWSSATEINNDFYTLERSFDGHNFEVVTTMDGAGNSSEKLDYQFEDRPNYYGNIFYRLTQTDFDGAFEQFDVIRVLYEPEMRSQRLYPSIATSGQMITIENFWGNEIKGIQLTLTDLNGRRTLPVQNLTINHQVQFGTANVSPGIYLLKGSINGLPVSSRLVIRN